MAKFKLEWNDGSVEEVNQVDCHTAEQYKNCRFGDTTPGATITMIEDSDGNPVEVSPTPKKKK